MCRMTGDGQLANRDGQIRAIRNIADIAAGGGNGGIAAGQSGISNRKAGESRGSAAGDLNNIAGLDNVGGRSSILHAVDRDGHTGGNRAADGEVALAGRLQSHLVVGIGMQTLKQQSVDIQNIPI